MKRHLLPLILALAPLGAAALDLTPTSAFRELEGFKVPIIVFGEAGRKCSLQPPPRWRVSGGGASLSLIPPDTRDAVVQLRVLPFKPVASGEQEDLDQWCRAQLPKDAAEPKLENENENVFTLGKLGSRQFTYSYGAQGRRFLTSVAVVNWNERQRLAVVVIARDTDFAAVNEAAMKAMFTWTAM